MKATNMDCAARPLDAQKLAERCDALATTASLVLEGISRHAVQTDPKARADFEQQMRRHIDGLRSKELTPELALSIGKASRQSIEEYSKRTSTQIRDGTREMQTMLLLMSTALTQSTQANDRVLARFHALEQRLDVVLQMVDVKAVREQLDDCLMALKASRQEVEESQAAQIATHEGIVASTPVQAALQLQRGQVDSATGLPGLSQALEAVLRALRSPIDWVVAAIVVERWDTVTARLGLGVGDELLGVTAVHAAEALGKETQLFRWRGPCLLALVERRSLLAVNAELSPLAARRIHNVQFSTRTALIPLSRTWAAFPLDECRSVLNVCRRIDQFLDGLRVEPRLQA